MAPVQPGTYRIVSVASGTYITLHNHWDAVCWRKLDNKNQQWYIQRSGEGYRIKNCLTGLYLVVSDTALGAKVFCGRYPTTWELNQGMEDHDMYIVKLAGCDRVVGLHWGKADDGNEVCFLIHSSGFSRKANIKAASYTPPGSLVSLEKMAV
ncbi:hypothetical protein FRC06_007987 [Ceratobasidium sp. 370]|nr:hypothetical protein FRC06_007987 [Ceratobasidium sp. 370]